jgi:hypothetical protein
MLYAALPVAAELKPQDFLVMGERMIVNRVGLPVQQLCQGAGASALPRAHRVNGTDHKGNTMSPAVHATVMLPSCYDHHDTDTLCPDLCLCANRVKVEDN